MELDERIIDTSKIMNCKMTLDEGIEHLEELLKNKEFPCESCKEEHKQLLIWLKELRTFKENKNG